MRGFPELGHLRHCRACVGCGVSTVRGGVPGCDRRRSLSGDSSCIVRRGPVFPLPRRTSANLVTKSRFVARIREAMVQAGIPTQSYSGHSFRIGAATTAAQAGLQVNHWADGLVRPSCAISEGLVNTHVLFPVTEISAD